MLSARIIAIVGPAILSAACASTGSDAAIGEARAGLANECIMDRTIRDFDPLDNRNLILYGPGNRAYHVVLSTPSMSLEREFMIGVVDRDGDNRICPYGGDRILIDGPLTEQIPIRSIERLDEAGTEALLVEFGKIEPADEAVTVTEIE